MTARPLRTIKTSAPHTPQQMLGFFAQHGQTLSLTLLVSFTLLVLSYYYLSASYQYVLKQHTTLSLKHHKSEEQERKLLSKLHRTQGNPTAFNPITLSDTSSFQRVWKKVKLRDITLVHVSAAPPTLSEHRPEAVWGE